MSDIAEPRIKLLTTFVTKIRWADMDALGHVNNAMYFRYFEQTRMDWYDDLNQSPLGATRNGMVIVNAFCEFLKPVVYPATIRIDMFGGEPGRSSFDSFYELFVEGDDSVSAKGSAKIVWIDTSIGRSIPLPSTVIELLPG